MTDEAPHLLTETTDDGILIATLNRPDKLNAITGQMMELLDEAVLRFRDTEALKVMLIRATGRYFSAGADLRDGMGEELPFADASADSVVTTFTLCSVADQARVLREIRRVLRPGGTAIFLEHGHAPDARVRRWQSRIEPVWKRIAGGCHLTRPIADAYVDAGFTVDRLGSRYMPKTPRPLGWIEWGTAIPA